MATLTKLLCRLHQLGIIQAGENDEVNDDDDQDHRKGGDGSEGRNDEEGESSQEEGASKRHRKTAHGKRAIGTPARNPLHGFMKIENFNLLPMVLSCIGQYGIDVVEFILDEKALVLDLRNRRGNALDKLMLLYHYKTTLQARGIKDI